QVSFRSPSTLNSFKRADETSPAKHWLTAVGFPARILEYNRLLAASIAFTGRRDAKHVKLNSPVSFSQFRNQVLTCHYIEMEMVAVGQQVRGPKTHPDCSGWLGAGIGMTLALQRVGSGSRPRLSGRKPLDVKG